MPAEAVAKGKADGISNHREAALDLMMNAFTVIGEIMLHDQP